MAKPDRPRYSRAVLDANVVIAFIQREDDTGPTAMQILTAAEEGEIEVFLPTVAAAEVVRWEDEPHGADFSRASDERIDRFLRSPFFQWVDVDQQLAARARNLVRSTEIRSGVDALYVATAQLVNADVVLTTDTNHLPPGAYGTVTVAEPYFAGQSRLLLSPEADVDEDLDDLDDEDDL